MYALIDGDILTYSVPFSLQEGYGDDAVLKDDAQRELQFRIDAFIQLILDETKAQDYKVFLSSKREDKLEENHRYQYLPQYKGSRSAPRPILWQEARDYLKMQHLALLSDKGLEADDMIAIEHTALWERENNPSIICSIDKDFDQLAGWHYTWPMYRAKKQIPSREYFVTEFQGLKNLYKQALTGDKADNIGYEVQDGKQRKCKYLQGLGEKKAEKILKDCETEVEMYQQCLSVYMQSIGDKDEAETTLHSNLHGLYLVRGFRGANWKIWRKPQ